MSFERSNDLLEHLGKDYKFTPTFDDCLIFEYRHFPKDKHTTRLRSVAPEERPREAQLCISNLLFSAGASHHYAKIKLGWPRHVHASNGASWNYGVHGYDLPFGASHVEFEVMRQVDKRDLKHDREMARCYTPALYGNMKRGEWTHGFWTEQEATDAGIRFFKEHFAPGWILVPDAWSEDQRPTFATT